MTIELSVSSVPRVLLVDLSQDGDLDHAVNLLRSANRAANRFDGKTHYPHLFSDSVLKTGELITRQGGTIFIRKTASNQKNRRDQCCRN